MLAGCSSTLLSPRNRLRSEASAQFQACHFPSMSTQRLDLPCSFSQKEASRSQPIRPVNLQIEKPSEARSSSCSLKKSISLPPLTTTGQGSVLEGRLEKNKNKLKRFADENFFDEDDSCINRAKRKRGIRKSDDCFEAGENLGLARLGSGSFWYHPSFEVPVSVSLLAGLNPQQAPLSLVCSEEEDSVCISPSMVITPSLPLPNNAIWVKSTVTETHKLGEENVEPSQGVVKEASESSTSSGSENSFSIRLNENVSEHEIGNGSRPHNPNAGVGFGAGGSGNNGDHDGFELISLLIACIEAMELKNIEGVNHFIAKLGELASPRGSSVSRLTAYYTEALALRVARVWPQIFHITPPRELNLVEDESGTAVRLWNQVSPIPQFIHFTSNEILLRGFEGKDKVHIIDFDIKQGLQWPGLFQSLAFRNNPPSHVRITGIGESKQELIETGERLAGFAGALNLPFEFHPVVDRLEDVRLWMLHVKEGECVAVNCIFQLHKMLYDGSGIILRDFLGLLRSTNPSIVIMAEQEAEHNHHSLETRLCKSLKYYSAIFDSLDVGLPQDSLARIKIEEMFAREIRNIIACEGRDRLERHEIFGKWSKLMEQGGFRNMGITEREFLQSQMLLKMYTLDNYSVEKQVHDDGSSALTLSWLDQSLYTVSAWAPIDTAGSSSTSYLQPS